MVSVQQVSCFIQEPEKKESTLKKRIVSLFLALALLTLPALVAGTAARIEFWCEAGSYIWEYEYVVPEA